MKKLLLSISIFLLMITGCAFKEEAFDITKVQSLAEEKEYQFLDVTNDFSEQDSILSVYLVATTLWQMEFYEFTSEEEAHDMFLSNQASFQQDAESTSSEIEKNTLNSHMYSLTTSDTFYYLKQVDHTVVYSKVGVEHRGKVLRFLKNIGY